MFFGLTMEDVRKLAYQIAVKNNLIEAGNRDFLGHDWLKGVLRRHPQVTPRTPEATSASRARGFNPEVVNKFYDVYEDLLDKYHFQPQNIYNVDETGMTTVQGTGSEILAMIGRRRVGCLTSAERGQLVTVVVCM